MSVGLYVHNSRIKQAGGVPPLARRGARKTSRYFAKTERLLSRRWKLPDVLG